MRRRQKAIKISPGDGEQAVGGRRRAVFLDRDGVINRMVYNSEFGLVDSPQNPEEFKLLPGVGEAIRLVNETGFLVVVVSNQPGVAKAKFTLDILEAMTQKMHDELAQAGAHLDGVYYCLHHPQAVVGSYRTTCTCRKPAPGLLIQAAEELSIDLASSYMIGDGLTDVQAGVAAGCRAIFLGQQKCYYCRRMEGAGVSPDWIAPNLAQAVAYIREEE